MSRTGITFLRPFTRRFVNPVTRVVAGHLPWFCILRYRGRKSGRPYRTPMNVFRRGEHWVFALTYGSEVQWVRNVLHAGSCEIETRGRVIRLERPQLVTDPTRQQVPRIVALFLGLLGVTEFLRMDQAQAPGRSPLGRDGLPVAEVPPGQ